MRERERERERKRERERERETEFITCRALSRRAHENIQSEYSTDYFFFRRGERRRRRNGWRARGEEQESVESVADCAGSRGCRWEGWRHTWE